MIGHKVQVKFYAREKTDAPLDSYVNAFHRWIQKGSLEELVIDVADYSHVPTGPGIMLIGHGSDYAIDLTDGRPGLMYSRKRDLPEGNDLIEDALRRAITASRLADEDQEIAGPRSFDTSEICFRFPDRLHIKNDETGFAAAKPAIESALQSVFPDRSYTLTKKGEGREPLRIVATI